MAKKIIIALSVIAILVLYSLSAEKSDEGENISKEPVSSVEKNYTHKESARNIILELKKPPFIN